MDQLQPDTPFSYTCRRCMRCCYDKRIQVNPYEIARLARNRGLTTGDLRDRFLIDGAVLRQKEDGSCVFLGPEGCSVHPDRPLVCRLFPLGRIVEEGGESRLCKPAFDPPAAGAFGTGATVSAYFDDQGAGPFIAAADAYFAWFRKAREHVERGCDGESDRDLLDIDSEIAAWCAAKGIDEPVDVEDRCRLHLDILYRELTEGERDVSF